MTKPVQGTNGYGAGVETDEDDDSDIEYSDEYLEYADYGRRTNDRSARTKSVMKIVEEVASGYGEDVEDVNDSDIEYSDEFLEGGGKDGLWSDDLVSATKEFFHVGGHRDGKDLVWTNVNMKLMGKKGTVEKDILKSISGRARAGQTTAIMGASGAGKSSLFNILAGRAKTRGRIKIDAQISLGGASIDPNSQLGVRTLFAYVAQEDSLHETSTPRESLTFSAKLRLPKKTSDETIKAVVNTYLTELGLEKAADTIIGGGLKKGISGGEKRRTSIGVELVSQPRFVFLDEPTSGLDAYAARQILSLLEKLAEAEKTVLFTIHQPASDAFRSFDHLILLHQGRKMYDGETENVPNDFGRMGFPVPENYNPADWLLDVAQMNSIEDLERKGFFPKDKGTLGGSQKLILPKRDHVSLWTEFGMLMVREKVSMIRNPMILIITACLTAFLSVVYGVIFYNIGNDDRSNPLVLQGQLGAIVNILISTMMGQSQTALSIFSRERPMFLREYSTNHYSIFTYFISHLATEAFIAFVGVLVQAILVYWIIAFNQTFWQFLAVTFSLSMTATAVSVLLGSIFSDSENAHSLFTLVVIPQFYFSGVFISVELIPSWVRWAQYLCSLTYASRLAFVYEFTDCEPGPAETNCEELLAQNGADPESVWWYWLALIGLFFAFRLSAMLILRKKGKDFQ